MKLKNRFDGMLTGRCQPNHPNNPIPPHNRVRKPHYSLSHSHLLLTVPELALFMSWNVLCVEFVNFGLDLCMHRTRSQSVKIEDRTISETNKQQTTTDEQTTRVIHTHTLEQTILKPLATRARPSLLRRGFSGCATTIKSSSSIDWLINQLINCLLCE